MAGLCPITEANLGDGIFAAPRFLEAGGRFGIGSDSNVRIALGEELRTLEYGQRLRERKRNRLGPAGASTGRYLFDAARRGGAQALGLNSGAIAPGCAADIVILDGDHPVLAAAPATRCSTRGCSPRATARCGMCLPAAAAL